MCIFTNILRGKKADELAIAGSGVLVIIFKICVSAAGVIVRLELPLNYIFHFLVFNDKQHFFLSRCCSSPTIMCLCTLNIYICP